MKKEFHILELRDGFVNLSFKVRNISYKKNNRQLMMNFQIHHHCKKIKYVSRLRTIFFEIRTAEFCIIRPTNYRYNEFTGES
jgi:hypothetical protein